MAERETNERRVYVLPAELVDRLKGYQTRNGITSEVEAVRRLLDTALQMRDTVTDILNKLSDRFNEEKELRMLARDVLAGHILVKEVRFDDKAVAFRVADGELGRIDHEGKIFTGSGFEWEHWDPVVPPHRARRVGGAAPSWDAPKGGDLDDEIPF